MWKIPERTECKVEGCEKKTFAKGWCSAHYTRWYKYGDPLILKQKQLHGLSLIERWSAYVKKTDGCWEWTGACAPNGYGQLRIGEITRYAHRLAWEFFRGSIPKDECILHHCDNRKCVNPDHLFLGDRVINSADKMSKNRHSSKLSVEQTVQVRDSSDPISLIASKYGITRSQVWRIRTRRSWRHLP
jgi:hypothetical protein